MVTGTVSPRVKGRAGFTLVELLLVTVLLLLMLGGVIFSFSTLQRNASLEEGGVPSRGAVPLRARPGLEQRTPGPHRL